MRRARIKMADRGPCIFFRKYLSGTCLAFFIFLISSCGGELWPLERPEGMPVIQSLEVMCGKDHMDVHLSFSHPFEGIVSSKGQHGDPRCVYVPPSTGQTFFSFRIAYARCGTKPDLHGQFYENTVVVQYDKDLLEVWDEAKRLRCEWFNDYEKTASKPPMVIADLDVIQLDFRGDNVDCWMEIQHGKGPWAPPVSGIVPLGSTLTLVVAINDYRGEFDMRVKSCAASDGAGHIIDLSDEAGCVLRPKMISRFLKAKAADDRASVITYAFFHAFKFPDALSVHIKCKVEICRHGCLEHCQVPGHGSLLDRKDDDADQDNQRQTISGSSESSDSLYDDIVADAGDSALIGGPPPPPPPPISTQQRQVPPPNGNQRPPGTAPQRPSGAPQNGQRPPGPPQGNGQRPPGPPPRQPPPPSTIQRPPPPSLNLKHNHPPPYHPHDDFDGELAVAEMLQKPFENHHEGPERFPHGPRNLEEQDVEIEEEDDDDSPSPLPAPLPAVAGPRNLDLDAMPPIIDTEAADEGAAEENDENSSEKPQRKRRSVVVSDRKVRSADVGVSGLYEVISEADLAFSPDNKAEAVTVFQGRIREEVVYGICLPVPGFSALFVLVAVSAVVSALVAGALLYRYQVQRERARQVPAMAAQSIASWMALRLLGNRQEQPAPPAHEENSH